MAVAAQGARGHVTHEDGPRFVPTEPRGAERVRGGCVAEQRVGLAGKGARVRDDGERVWETGAREGDNGDGAGAGARGILDRTHEGSRGCVGEGAGEGEVGRGVRIAGGGGVIGAVAGGSGGVMDAVDGRRVWGRWYWTDWSWSDDLGHNCRVWGCGE